MDMDLRSYVKLYENCIDNKKCKKIIKDLSKVKWEKHVFYDYRNDSSTSKSGSKELNVTSEVMEETGYVMQKIWEAYNQYIVLDFNFSWFDGWEGFSQVRFNEYKKGQKMALHCDHIQDLFEGKRRGIPILTALGCLNEDFEGGDFVMWDKVIKLKAGDIMVFPSVFLYPHRVEPVTKGKRYTFVSWAW